LSCKFWGIISGQSLAAFFHYSPRGGAAPFTRTLYCLRNPLLAVLVSCQGKLIAERYADGFDGDTPLRSMSMTKSATATLIGISVQQGRQDVDAHAPIDGRSSQLDQRQVGFSIARV